ncbi:hypothetical protein ACWEPC_02740 [Nonomuraea sp. NPDC004297]
MNTTIRQSRAPRRGRLAAIALTGAVAGVMLLPLGQGMASASVGFPAVEAGGPPPSKPAPVVKTRVVHREKPVLRNPRWHQPRIDIIVDNHNHSRNNNRHHVHRRHEDHKHEEVKYEPVREELEQAEETATATNNNNPWWWPEELS